MQTGRRAEIEDTRTAMGRRLSRLNGKQTHHLPLSLSLSVSAHVVEEKDFVCNNNEASLRLQPIGISITHQSGTFLWCRSQGSKTSTTATKRVEYDELDTARGIHPSHIACSSCNANASLLLPPPSPPSPSPSPISDSLWKWNFYWSVMFSLHFVDCYKFHW